MKAVPGSESDCFAVDRRIVVMESIKRYIRSDCKLNFHRLWEKYIDDGKNIEFTITLLQSTDSLPTYLADAKCHISLRFRGSICVESGESSLN